MLAQATGNAATSIEPAVIVAFVVGVLAFVASGRTQLGLPQCARVAAH